MAGRHDAPRQPCAKPHPGVVGPPLQVVPSAARCVRPDGMFCSFSPCIEQVRRPPAAPACARSLMMLCQGSPSVLCRVLLPVASQAD